MALMDKDCKTLRKKQALQDTSFLLQTVEMRSDAHPSKSFPGHPAARVDVTYL